MDQAIAATKARLHKPTPVTTDKAVLDAFFAEQKAIVDEAVAGDRASVEIALKQLDGLQVAPPGEDSEQYKAIQTRIAQLENIIKIDADQAPYHLDAIGHGLKLALAGVVVGVGAAFALTHLIASFLYGVKSWDPAVFITVPMVLSAVALAAVWLPAMRASRLDPMRALRIE